MSKYGLIPLFKHQINFIRGSFQAPPMATPGPSQPLSSTESGIGDAEPIDTETRSVQLVGNSLYSSLPDWWARANELDSEQDVQLQIWRDFIVITPGGDSDGN